MHEIEVKILEVDVKKITEKLNLLGAKKVFEGSITTTFFDSKNGLLKKNGNVLRLRQIGDKVILCFKTPLSKDDVKIMDEREVEVVDYESAKNVLDARGYQEQQTLIKKRVSYVINKTRFEIDYYDGIPPFLEIEGESEEEVLQWMERLGFEKSEAKPWNFKEVFEYYQRRRRV